jgi:hypothetical protein
MRRLKKREAWLPGKPGGIGIEEPVQGQLEWRKRMGIEPTPDAETGTGQRF